MDDFDQFWLAYPLRVKKKDAQKTWNQLAPSPALVSRIMDALATQALARARRLALRQWVPEWPYPASWIRGERWTDETEDAPRMTLVTAEDLKAMREEGQARSDAKRARDQAAIKAAAEDS